MTHELSAMAKWTAEQKLIHAKQWAYQEAEEKRLAALALAAANANQPEPLPDTIDLSLPIKWLNSVQVPVILDDTPSRATVEYQQRLAMNQRELAKKK